MTSHSVTGYTVYPTGIEDTVLDVSDQHLYLIQVEEAAPGAWAVRQMFGGVLNVDLRWQREPRPSDRDGEFLSTCRFETAEAALAAAEKVVDYQVWCGRSFAQADAWARAQL